MSDYIKVNLMHNLYKDKKWIEIKLNKFDCIEKIKNKIYTHTGTPPDKMTLYAFDEFNVDNTQVALSNCSMCLNDYKVNNNYTIYVHEQNNNLSNNDIIYNIDNEENLEKLKHLKYEISKEEYDKRSKDFRSFLKNMKEKQKSIKKSESCDSVNDKKNNTNYNNGSDVTIKNIYDKSLYQVGNRCKVKIGDRRGVLKFIGELKNNSKEIFVGVDLDEPLGNSDGTYQNKLLFECKGEKYGYIGNINSIEVGNFEPFNVMDLEEF
ncbi:tubulin-specific chaperone, putative [Hepatocystis sp. ex Piliocolobus tephrosceles]|nr:tubulin-specific chaperone, putative [Hepatocystis sp. ex Piliocolobus tephrosceles]